jgi:hypothetical protein
MAARCHDATILFSNEAICTAHGKASRRSDRPIAGVFVYDLEYLSSWHLAMAATPWKIPDYPTRSERSSTSSEANGEWTFVELAQSYSRDFTLDKSLSHVCHTTCDRT